MTCIVRLTFQQELVIARLLQLITFLLINLKIPILPSNHLPNGLSDHDAQILMLHDIKIQNLRAHHYTKRQINEFTISEFKLNLSYESWDAIFTEENLDSVFNSFLNTYLRIFYHSFSLKKVYHSQHNKAWITTGIKISSQHKRYLYLLCRSTNNPKLTHWHTQTSVRRPGSLGPLIHSRL